MKTKLRLLFALVAASPLAAAPLTSTTAVYSRPDFSAPTIAVLNAGTEPAPAIGIALALPPGWQAVEVGNTHEAFVRDKDFTKSLDVKPGSSIHTQPKAEAPVLTTMEAGDTAEIVGTRGKWLQVRLQKKITGYINTGPRITSGTTLSTPAPGASAVPAPAAATASNTAQPPPGPAPMAPTASGFAGPGRPASMINLGDGGSSALPRLFEGKFASTRRPLMPRRPYDFQLSINGNERYAYLDVSKLLLTEQIDKYIDHTVVVHGTAKPVEGTKDIVIAVESLQLR